MIKERLNRLPQVWMRVSTAFLPFADAASAELPLTRLIRLSLFQVTVGMALALAVGTLNRVMIVELGVSATLVSIMIGLPIVFAPFRALVGFKSDTHRSALGWRRVPYIWFGTMLQFGGLALMPFALIVLTGDNGAPVLVGQIAAGLAFLMIGAGLQTVQTAGLALATDLAPEAARPRVVALMYVMLLAGMVASGFVFGLLLIDFTPQRLIQVIQGAAVVTIVLNLVALWKQEGRNPAATTGPAAGETFATSWRAFIAVPHAVRFLVAVGLGTAAFGLQDVLLEPYGGEILKLPVSQTTVLTALMAGGALVAFGLAARLLTRGWNAVRLAAYGALAGVPGFSLIVLAAPMEAPVLFFAGTLLVGFGNGLFAVGTLTAAMGFDVAGRTGLALGAWGAVQASAAGLAIGLGGALRDGLNALAGSGSFGAVFAGPSVGYTFVYHLEILLLFATLAAIGPLARLTRAEPDDTPRRFGLSEMPH